ncbi:uncharacterized protein LOC143048879 [Mytilus galloprovincialis]|uniref:uncharacterized protein LOC143048879 n=1 Tax=Mytilus galloprovincialis TaxID=29158 RepID=UPI003F7B6458
MDNFRNGVISELCLEIDSSISTMGNRKLLFVSELMKKDVSSLKSLEWSQIIKEMMEKLPVLCTLLFSTMLPPQQRSCYTKIEKVIPKAAFVYAILMQSRNIELSRVQRMVSMLLMDNICDQKVYDRLQPLGACLCYGRTLTVVDLIGGSFNHHLIDNLKLKRFRIIGDNVNWKSSVHDERIDNKSHMEHAFASAVIVQNTDFSYLHMPSPFHCTMQVNEFRDYIPNPNDIQNIKYDYTILIARVLQNHIPFFRQFKDVIPNEISSPISDKLKQKSRVIPLAVLHKNEQRYQDVVGILDYYEKVVEDVFSSVGKNMDDVKIHIGGDLLTRERFSGAKNLRAYHVDPKEKFSHLSPITFELFHLLMNFLTMTFKMLYSKESGAELGTLKSFQDRISRSNVGEDADRDFFISVVDMHIVECILHYFGMESVSSVPTVHVPPSFNNLEEKRQWLFETIGDVISKYVLSDSNTNECWTEEAIKVNGQPVVVQLTDGRKVTLMKKSKAPKYDYVKNYAQMMLELGLLFKDLMDMIKLPERTRGIRLLKVAMLYFKSHKNLSKYALDILRFLVHQLILLSEKEANEEFYGLFVNTNGHFNGHIPADLAMEHLVKKVKDHLKHMFSNKTESNIMNRTKALGAIRDIAENFEKQSKVIVRAKKHSDKSAADDEKIILKDLRKLKPFQFEAGRAHEHFSKIPSTIVNQLNTSHYFEWIEPRIQMFATEIGN